MKKLKVCILLCTFHYAVVLASPLATLLMVSAVSIVTYSLFSLRRKQEVNRVNPL